ncbi:hypothetical protein QJS10_CPB14g01544 [Acorus calamus]|uniref:Protein kinase domain-containing protein n=1 Tax=Acorus calamus TaxID=4465 RepID=A0AAV9DBW5_ACOCL|nr:hypothetical protein QJS10_CPB14g01544 [Acorus calamus]
MKAVLGAARGLSFLHSEMNRNPMIIYRDFKSANVLLDSNYNAKLSDFGLAIDCPARAVTHEDYEIMGTKGYAAPEYELEGIVTPKSDVYGFGVVLVEVLSGHLVSNQQNLVAWARPNLNPTRLSFVLDHRLGQKYSLNEIREVAALALRCLNEDYMNRPFMAEVLEELEQAIHGLSVGRTQGINNDQHLDLLSFNLAKGQHQSVHERATSLPETATSTRDGTQKNNTELEKLENCYTHVQEASRVIGPRYK